MTGLLRLGVVISVGVAGALSPPAIKAAQQRSPERMPHYSLVAANLWEALHRVGSDFRFPVGVEWVRGPAELRPIAESWTNVTVFEVIASIIDRYGGYEMTRREGILQVSPRGFASESAAVANLQISEFSVKNEVLGAATFRLRQVIQQARQEQPRPPSGAGEAFSIAYGPEGRRRVTFELAEPGTLRGVLDGLVLAAGEMNWVVTYSGRAARSGSVPTTVTLRGDAVPDEMQPLWSFVPWGAVRSVRARRD